MKKGIRLTQDPPRKGANQRVLYAPLPPPPFSVKAPTSYTDYRINYNTCIHTGADQDFHLEGVHEKSLLAKVHAGPGPLVFNDGKWSSTCKVYGGLMRKGVWST